VQDLLEKEVTEALGREKSERRNSVDPAPGYRNGHGRPRSLTMACGTITVRRPRVRGLEDRFETRVLPLSVRRTQTVDALLPELYLHGLAQGDFDLALRRLLGETAPLSASTIARLKERWEAALQEWSSRPLDELEVVSLWVDGLYVKAGLEKDKAPVLVVVAGLADGRDVVVALQAGHREWTASWTALLRDLRRTGLRDWARMVTFYDFPQERWRRLRMRNVIESPFAALRLRTVAAKRLRRIECGTAVIFKLLLVAEQSVRPLTAADLAKEVFLGVEFVNGVSAKDKSLEAAAIPSSASSRHLSIVHGGTPSHFANGSGRALPAGNSSTALVRSSALRRPSRPLSPRTHPSSVSGRMSLPDERQLRRGTPASQRLPPSGLRTMLALLCLLDPLHLFKVDGDLVDRARESVWRRDPVVFNDRRLSVFTDRGTFLHRECHSRSQRIPVPDGLRFGCQLRALWHDAQPLLTGKSPPTRRAGGYYRAATARGTRAPASRSAERATLAGRSRRSRRPSLHCGRPSAEECQR